MSIFYFSWAHIASSGIAGSVGNYIFKLLKSTRTVFVCNTLFLVGQGHRL